MSDNPPNNSDKCIICGVPYCDDHGDVDNPIEVLYMISVDGDWCPDTGYTFNSIIVVGIDKITQKEVDYKNDNVIDLGYGHGEGWTKYPFFSFVYKNDQFIDKWGDPLYIILLTPKSSILTSFRELKKNKNMLFEWVIEYGEKLYVSLNPEDLFNAHKIKEIDDIVNIQKLTPGIDKYLQFLDKDGVEIK